MKQASSSYTVSNITSNGGNITFNSAPASGTLITIIRNLSIKRTSDFQEGASLRANVLNDELDYQIACQQQIAENLNRSMTLPPYAVNTDVNLTLPTPSAGKAIVWNSEGTNLENSTVAVNALESTLNGYKTAAQSAASTATTKAELASDKADIATTQAGIATTKATEVASALSTKANTAMDNLSSAGQTQVVALNRNWTNVGSYVANGNSSIAGTYSLGFTDNDVKIGIFLCHLVLSNAGGSNMAITSDVMNTTGVTLTNNSFGTEDLITIPFKKNITISFLKTDGGVNNAYVYFVGYM